MKKKIISIVLTGSMLIAVASCGNKNISVDPTTVTEPIESVSSKSDADKEKELYELVDLPKKDESETSTSASSSSGIECYDERIAMENSSVEITNESTTIVKSPSTSQAEQKEQDAINRNNEWYKETYGYTFTELQNMSFEQLRSINGVIVKENANGTVIYYAVDRYGDNELIKVDTSNSASYSGVTID